MSQTDHFYILAVTLKYEENPSTDLIPLRYKKGPDSTDPFYSIKSQSIVSALSPPLKYQREAHVKEDRELLNSLINLGNAQKKENRPFIHEPFVTFSTNTSCVFTFNHLEIKFKSPVTLELIYIGELADYYRIVPSHLFYKSSETNGSSDNMEIENVDVSVNSPVSDLADKSDLDYLFVEKTDKLQKLLTSHSRTVNKKLQEILTVIENKKKDLETETETTQTKKFDTITAIIKCFRDHIRNITGLVMQANLCIDDYIEEVDQSISKFDTFVKSIENHTNDVEMHIALFAGNEEVQHTMEVSNQSDLLPKVMESCLKVGSPAQKLLQEVDKSTTGSNALRGDIKNQTGAMPIYREKVGGFSFDFYEWFTRKWANLPDPSHKDFTMYESYWNFLFNDKDKYRTIDKLSLKKFESVLKKDRIYNNIKILLNYTTTAKCFVFANLIYDNTRDPFIMSFQIIIAMLDMYKHDKIGASSCNSRYIMKKIGELKDSLTAGYQYHNSNFMKTFNKGQVRMTESEVNAILKNYIVMDDLEKALSGNFIIYYEEE